MTQIFSFGHNLEDNCSALVFLLGTKLEGLATLQHLLITSLAVIAGQAEHDLLCCLGLLVENRLCLTTIATLFAIVSSTTLAKGGLLALFVLSNLVLGVLFALGAESVLLLRDVHLRN